MDTESLLNLLKEKFKEAIENDKFLAVTRRSFENGKSLQYVYYNFSINRIGIDFVNAFKSIFTEDFIGEKGLFYNTFRESIEPVLLDMFDEVMDISKIFTNATYIESQLGIKSVVPSINEAFVNINYLKEEACKEGLTYEQIVNVFEDYIPTTNKYFVDEFMRKNADVANKLGFTAKVVRTARPGTCEFCAKREGTYKYDDVRDKGNPVWQRHRGCMCSVVYENQYTRTNAHTKKSYDLDVSYEEIKADSKQSLIDIDSRASADIDKRNQQKKVEQLTNYYIQQGYSEKYSGHLARKKLREG